MKILILGGNKFFGKRLAQNLIQADHDITLLNRGNVSDGLKDQVKRIKCDRTDPTHMQEVLKNSKWDVVYDQICFDYHMAKEACEIFSGNVKHYIHTSSQSVYHAGKDLTEENFNPKIHEIKNFESMDSNYGEAKRQAEVAFSKYADFSTTFVRFPIVIGPDDYTQRFKFHLDAIKNKEEIYFKNLEARISFISSEEAAFCLEQIAHKNILGPLNCCNKNSIQIGYLLKLMEQKIGEKSIIAKERTETNMSPYGIGEDWFMSSNKLIENDIHLRPIVEMIELALNECLN